MFTIGIRSRTIHQIGLPETLMQDDGVPDRDEGLPDGLVGLLEDAHEGERDEQVADEAADEAPAPAPAAAVVLATSVASVVIMRGQ